jgi:hypothetical protein
VTEHGLDVAALNDLALDHADETILYVGAGTPENVTNPVDAVFNNQARGSLLRIDSVVCFAFERHGSHFWYSNIVPQFRVCITKCRRTTLVVDHDNEKYRGKCKVREQARKREGGIAAN